jgi:hypothetical protein
MFARWTFGERTERSRTRLVEMFKIYILVCEMKTNSMSKQELFPARRGPFRIARYEDADRLANVAGRSN